MGTDKALLCFNKNYLINNEIKQLKLIFSQVSLVTNNLYKFDTILDTSDICLIKDIYPNKGPLGGIYTALKMSKLPYIFIMACDMPFPDIRLIEQMYSSINHNQVLIIGHDKHIEPLFAFYHRSCLPIIKNQLDNNCLKIRDMFNQVKTKIYWVDDAQKSSFVNLNTPQEFEKWQLKN